LNDEKWVKTIGAQYPWCFDLSNDKAKIGGGDETGLDGDGLKLEFVECN
jgi:hypothetical protein